MCSVNNSILPPLPSLRIIYQRPHHLLQSIHHCYSLQLAQTSVILRGNQPVPLQLPGEWWWWWGSLHCFFVRSGVGAWISVFSLSHFDLNPIPDSWYCRWTWHSALPLCKSGMGRREWDWEEQSFVCQTHMMTLLVKLSPGGHGPIWRGEMSWG